MLLATSCVQPEEKERIGRFVFKKDFKASLVGRLLMRKFVNEFTGVPYAEINFGRDEHGKPVVKYPLEGSFRKVSFNVSHHGDVCVLAGEMGDIPLGVDVMRFEVERHKNIQEYFRVMNRQCADKEWETIKCEPDELSQIKMFYRHWCLKESYVKALGVGVTINLRNLCFKLETRRLKQNEIVRTTELQVSGEKMPWVFEESLLNEEHCVAVALRKKDLNANDEGVVFKHLDLNELMLNCAPVIKEDDEFCRRFFRKS